MTASIATYPHEVVRTRMQTQRRPIADDLSSDGMIKQHPRGGIIYTTRKLIAKEGWTSLYKGLSINLLRTVPNSAVTMLTWVKVLIYLSLSILIFNSLAQKIGTNCSWDISHREFDSKGIKTVFNIPFTLTPVPLATPSYRYFFLRTIGQVDFVVGQSMHFFFSLSPLPHVPYSHNTFSSLAWKITIFLFIIRLIAPALFSLFLSISSRAIYF